MKCLATGILLVFSFASGVPLFLTIQYDLFFCFFCLLHPIILRCRTVILYFKTSAFYVHPLLCSSCCQPSGGSNTLLIPPFRGTLNSGTLLSTMTFRSRCACGPCLPFTFPIVQQSVNMPEIWKLHEPSHYLYPHWSTSCFERSTFWTKMMYVNETHNQQPVDSLIFT